VDTLKEKLKEIDGGKILDVATGRGGFIPTLTDTLKSYDEITGIDNSEDNLKQAREQFKDKNYNFMNMTAENLQFEDSNFDTVSISHSLHHLPEIDKSLSEIKRVLKPGGLCIAGEMFSDNQGSKQQNYVNLHHWWGEIDRATGVSHNPTFRRQEIMAMFEQLGLTKLDFFDQSSSEEIDWEKAELDKIIDQYIAKIKDTPNSQVLINKGNRIRADIKENGVITPTTLYILGRK
jgi:ubiquinone/menaquinone biosynthesis C-methylase UbiE